MQDTKQEYEYSYYNSELLDHHNYLLPPLLKLISRETITQNQKARVLDLGCGNGSLTQQIARQGYEVVGVEDSISGIEVARQNIRECNFILASIYDLPYEELADSFDVVVAAEVIEHLIYPRELLRNAKKCLKPGGNLVITTPYHSYWKHLVIALLGKADKHFDPLWDGGHVKFFSVATMTKIFQEEGFTDIKFKFAGRTPYLWKSMLCSGILAK
jgi:2-polyprenyl-3-methyl-5-hydroxy-6-metoxy-1,4-benzoquinol methylase